MKFKHYFNPQKINKKNKEALNNLIYSCDFFAEKEIESIIDPIIRKSAICVFNDIDEICGFATLIDEDDCLYLSELFVEDKLRGKGYGSALISQVRNYLLLKNIETAVLQVKKENKGARKLYEERRFLYYRNDPNFNFSLMKIYASSNAYVIGGILHETEKRFGRRNLSEGLKQIEKYGNFSDFYKYFRGNDKNELIKKYLSMETTQNAAQFLQDVEEEKTISRFIYRDPNDLSADEKQKFRNILSLPKADVKKAAVCADVCMSFKVHEKIVSELQKEHEKSRER